MSGTMEMQNVNSGGRNTYNGQQSSLKIPNSVLIDEFGQEVGSDHQREARNQTEQDNYVLSYDKL